MNELNARVNVLTGDGDVVVTGTVTGSTAGRVVVTDDAGFEYDAGFDPAYVKPIS